MRKRPFTIYMICAKLVKIFARPNRRFLYIRLNWKIGGPLKATAIFSTASWRVAVESLHFNVVALFRCRPQKNDIETCEVPWCSEFFLPLSWKKRCGMCKPVRWRASVRFHSIISSYSVVPMLAELTNQ